MAVRHTEVATWLSRITEQWCRDLGKFARRSSAKANGRADTIRRLLAERTRENEHGTN